MPLDERWQCHNGSLFGNKCTHLCWLCARCLLIHRWSASRFSNLLLLELGHREIDAVPCCAWHESACAPVLCLAVCNICGMPHLHITLLVRFYLRSSGGCCSWPPPCAAFLPWQSACTKALLHHHHILEYILFLSYHFRLCCSV